MDQCKVMKAVDGHVNNSFAHVDGRHTGNGCAPSNDVRSSPDQRRWEAIEETTAYLLARTKHRPTVAIICGSGLGGLGRLVEDSDEFQYRNIPNFTQTGVKGHAGRLLFGRLGGKCVICMQGRIHAYEGHSMWDMTFPVRIFHSLGVQVMLATNASGSLREDFRPGDLMLMKDHINLFGLVGLNPLVGLADERFGPRFPAMSTAYDVELRRLGRQVATELGMQSFFREGVYFCQTGPCYETVSEGIMARRLGADVVGMSTCAEVMVARHSYRPIRCIGLSLITNNCIMQHDVTDAANHEEVLQTADMRSDDLQKFVSTLVARIPIQAP